MTFWTLSSYNKISSSMLDANFSHVKLNIDRTAVSDAAYSVTATDYLIAFTSLSAARTVTVADELAVAGREFVINDEKGNAGTNFIVVQPETRLINGVAAYTVAANYGSARIYSDGANWFVL